MDLMSVLEKMRKGKVILAIVSLAILVFVAVAFMLQGKQTATYTVPGKDLTFDMPAIWNQLESGNADFKFQDLKSYFSGFVYGEDDAQKIGQDRTEFLRWMNEQIVSARENVQVVQPETAVQADGKTVTTALYSGEKDGQDFYYYLVWIEFDNSDHFIWGVFSAEPSYAGKHLEEWNGIARSARIGA